MEKKWAVTGAVVIFQERYEVTRKRKMIDEVDGLAVVRVVVDDIYNGILVMGMTGQNDAVLKVDGEDIYVLVDSDDKLKGI
jgi:hypothetical protein